MILIVTLRSFHGYEASGLLVKCMKIRGFVCAFSAAALLPYTAASSVYIFIVTVFVITVLVKYCAFSAFQQVMLINVKF